MIRALYSAASGMSAQQMNIDNIAHNLANANTNGFKMRRTQFQDLLYQSFVQPGAAAGSQTVVPSGLQIGLGTRPAANEIIFSQGKFQLDRDGNMVTANGDPIEPQITIPAQAQNITIATDGTVSYTQPGQTASQVAGQIQLANFANPAGLNSIGQNLFMPTDASGDPTIGNP